MLGQGEDCWLYGNQYAHLPKPRTYLSSFMAISKGSVSPSNSTITGAHILGQNINNHLSECTEKEEEQLSTCLPIHLHNGQ